MAYGRNGQKYKGGFNMPKQVKEQQFMLLCPAQGEIVPPGTPIVGMGKPHANIMILIDNYPKKHVLVGSDGHWRLSAPRFLPKGQHTICAAHFSSQGVEMCGATFEIKDILAPAPSVLHPAQGQVIGTKELVFTGRGIPGYTVFLRLNGVGETLRAIVSEEGRFAIPYPQPLKEGQYTISALQMHESEGASAAASVDFSVSCAHKTIGEVI